MMQQQNTPFMMGNQQNMQNTWQSPGYSQQPMYGSPQMQKMNELNLNTIQQIANNPINNNAPPQQQTEIDKNPRIEYSQLPQYTTKDCWQIKQRDRLDLTKQMVFEQQIFDSILKSFAVTQEMKNNIPNIVQDERPPGNQP